MHIKHYADGRIYEPIDVIRDWELDFCLGNAVKYIARCGRKGSAHSAINDIDKAIDYLNYKKEELAHGNQD